MLTFSLSLFTACSDDDDPENLMLDKNEITLDIGATETIKITKGNGDYKLSSNESLIATAEISGSDIKVTAIKDGSTTFEISDKEGKKVTLKVVVRDYAESVEGIYGGELVIKLAGAEFKQTKDIEISRTYLNKIKVSLIDFSIELVPGSPISLGDIIVDNIPVEKNADSYIIKETSQKLSLNIGQPIEVNVIVSGTVKDNNLELLITVEDVPEMGTIEVTFAGDKKVDK